MSRRVARVLLQLRQVVRSRVEAILPQRKPIANADQAQPHIRPGRGIFERAGQHRIDILLAPRSHRIDDRTLGVAQNGARRPDHQAALQTRDERIRDPQQHKFSRRLTVT